MTDPWPFGDARAADGHHRILHLFSTRWCRLEGERECAIAWKDAERLRKEMAGRPGRPLAEAFAGYGHLRRQYARVADRMPAVVGAPRDVVVPHGHWELPGQLFLVRLASGHPVACLSLEADGGLDRLPHALIAALEQGPGLEVLDRGTGGVATLQECVAASAPGPPKLMLASEMHTMIVVRTGDETLTGDDELVRRLLGRLPNSQSSVRDPAILWPGEFNRGEHTIGAVRPGASVLAGHPEPCYRNAFVSALMLIGSASLLREAREESYAIVDEVADAVQTPQHRWSLTGADPLATEQARLAAVEIAVGFQVESHLDIRRIISDAYLSDFHRCLAAALAIPHSVEAISHANARVDAAIRATSTRLSTRNVYAISLVVAVVLGVLAVVADLVG